MFEDRLDVGRQLGEKLKSIVSGKGLVLGIPRGGMVVADEVAKILKWPLGVCVTKKIGLPGQEELAVGAMGLDGIVVWDKKLLKVLGLKEDDLRQQVEITRKKIDRLFEKVRPSRQATRSDLAKKAVVLVDDGIATGQTVEAAIKWLRMKRVEEIILAVPVCAKDTIGRLKGQVDKFVCLEIPEDFRAVGQFYEVFDEVSDEEVEELLV